MGNMPDGNMSWSTIDQPCGGFEKFKTIQIHYDFRNGKKADGT